MQQTSIKRKRREQGGSIVEVALMAPWIFFLFVGVFDMGFYSYAIICTENAARAAAIRTAASAGAQDDTLACRAALAEMYGQPNLIGVTACAANAAAVTDALPVGVERKTLCGKDVDTSTITTCISAPPTNPLCADCDPSLDSTGASSQVAVTYRGIPLVPIPGILTGRLTVTRTSEMRIISE